MKITKIKFPYISYEVSLFFEDVEYHSDRRVRENVIAMMGYKSYKTWEAMHEKGVRLPCRIRTRVHIIDALKDPAFMGVVIGYLIGLGGVVGLSLFVLKFAHIGLVEVIEFIKGL